ncbi:MAG: hypothetical protein IT384_34330 [Deltaproteobacteria bacterium]|nr:hypothetical protein [Deltaproteobacteria bacterium]
MHRFVLVSISLSVLTSCGHEKTEEAPGAAPETSPTSTEILWADEAEETREAEEAKRAARRAEAQSRLHTLKGRTKPATADALWEGAESAYQRQNWKEARDGFQAFAVQHAGEARAPLAVQRATMASFAIGEYGEGLTWHEDALELFRGTIHEARLLKSGATTLLAAPHWGTKKGGELLRGRWDQGIYQDLHRVDRARAIRWLEDARDVAAAVAAKAKPEEADAMAKERIEIQQDLVSAIVRFTPFDVDWAHWYYAWNEALDDERADEEGADERGAWWAQQRLHRAEPRGLPVDESGNVIFTPTPERYDRDLNDTAKLKWLLAEIAEIDPTPKKDLAASALYRQALLFRARDGSERLQRLAQWWWNGAYPYQKDLQAAEPWKLADDEILGLIATHVGVVRVPPDESVLALLRRVIAEYPGSSAVEPAKIAIAAYYQSRSQLTRAVEEYERYLRDHPKGTQEATARGQLELIRQPGIEIHSERPQLAGKAARFPLEHRNLARAHVRAVRIDLERALADFKAAWIAGRARGIGSSGLPDHPTGYLFAHDDGNNYRRYAKGEARRFELQLADDGAFRARKSEPEVPITEPGLWVLEVYADAAEKQLLGRGPLMLEDSVVLLKNSKHGLLFAVDAASGQPIGGAKIEIFEYWSEWPGKATEAVYHHRSTELTTNGEGIAAPIRGETRGQRLISLRKGGRFTWATGWYAGYYAPQSEEGVIGLVFTDRPVYRPLDKVELQAWARVKRGGKYEPASSVRQLRIEVYDPKGAKVYEESRPAGAEGGAHFGVPLPKNAALGLYTVQVQADGNWVTAGGNQFRVEEYKAPEVEVTVEVGDGPAKLGEPIAASIRGQYYFGGPVEGAKVHYKVYRTESDRRFSVPGPWDWLYGPGYGRIYYAYPWFGWWTACGPRPWRWYPWWGPEPEARRELVMEGQGALDSQGSLRFTIETQRSKELYGDQDQRFIVEAEVTDASRRTIRGEGEVLATRNQFFVHLEPDRGYYDTGSTVRLEVRTLLPTGAPIATKGELRIAKVALTADNGDTLEEAPVLAVPAATDAEGRLEHRWDAKEAGQYRLSYVTRDAWGSEVIGSTLIWVWGAGFDGRRFRFNHLEVLTDRRTYQVGETARLLISSDVAGAHVLFSPRAENGFLFEPRVVALEGKTKIIELPITEAHVPNFFVEATLVGGGKLSEEIRELFVPPPAAEVKVAITPKSREAKPGTEGELEVRTYGADDRPIAAEVAISIFDRSILYIQPELTPDVRKNFWGRLRSHSLISSSNLSRQYQVYQWMIRPEQNANGLLSMLGRSGLIPELDFAHSDLKDLEGRLVGGTFGDAAGGGGLGARAASSPAPASVTASGELLAEDKNELAKSGGKADEDSRAAGHDRAERRDQRGPAPALRTAEVRRRFADTAHFSVVKTDAEGRATVRWTFPDNVGSWRVRAIAVTAKTEVGEGTAAMTTARKLMVRLQSPRFFRERDRVLISANVHNRLGKSKRVRVRLETTESLLQPEGKRERWVEVGDGKEERVDFWVNVRGEGEAKVMVAAETDEESDAKELTLPVLVHGMMKTVSAVGSISATAPETAERSIEIEVPAERRVDESELIVRWAPTLAGAMIDALPFLLEYPYGCTEQTVSRFVPAAITRRVLQQSGGVRLEDLEKLRGSLNPQQLPGEGDAAYQARLALEQKRYDRNPVYSTALMNDMIATGVARLAKMQRSDGGWGWWGSDSASIYTTAYVLAGLWEAQQADVTIPAEMIARARSAMHSMILGHLSSYDQHDWASDEDAYFAYVMSLFGEQNDRLSGYLFDRRERLSGYGKSLFAIALHHLGRKEDARLLLRNAAQRLKEDPENETVWLETKSEGWWYWWNDDVETNATFLRALITIDPQDARAPKLVKWLLNHRHNGWYWRSTRDTAVTLGAFGHYLRASGEQTADYDLEVWVDDRPIKSVHIDRRNLLTFDGELRLRGKELTTGKHRITLRRTGRGAVYFNSYLSYFTLEEDVAPAGLEIKVDRRYFRLVRDDRAHQVFDQRGRAQSMREAAYRKLPLESGAELKSGDLVLVELLVESKNDYQFLAFEDPKPAGMEPVALRSGVTYGEAVANLELRDEKVVFFLRELNQGKLKLEYRLRAEIPGLFHAMPTRGFAMYAPELRANAREVQLGIKD